jgi:predicted site-specific integrase-resolvase
MKKLLSVRELCDTMGVARSTIYDWKKSGKLPEPSKKWGSPRYDWDEVQKALSVPKEQEK